MITHQFYIELGKLLYAIAIRDGVIQEKEKKMVDDLFRRELHHFKMYFKSMEEFRELIHIKLSFYTALQEKHGEPGILQAFKMFYLKNGHLLKEHQINLARHLVRKMALAFKGIETEELKLIDELFGKPDQKEYPKS